MNKENSTKGDKEHLETFCQQVGLRLTHQRLEIYIELTKSIDHPSAEMLYQKLYLRLPTLSLDTVYRTLSMFCKYKLIRKVATIESQARFELASEHHHHLFCKNCYVLIDIYWPELDLLKYPTQPWVNQIESLDAVFTGICPKCTNTAKNNRTFGQVFDCLTEHNNSAYLI